MRRKHPKKGCFSEDGNGQEEALEQIGDDINISYAQELSCGSKGKDDCMGELSSVVFKFPALEYVTKVNVLVAKGIDLSSGLCGWERQSSLKNILPMASSLRMK